jgi:RNA 2',3'-cyclic 3'-phosphodiesterase
VRLFAALDVPPAVRSALAAWARAAVGADGRLRLVAAESLHATLVFVGERADPEPVAAALASALTPPPPAPLLSVAAPLWLSPRRPHVLTVALEDPSGGLARIQAAVLDAFVREAGHEVRGSARAFRPHVTVARVRGRLRPFELPAPPAVDFHPPAVTLYRSILNTSPPGPAVYEAMASVPLSTLS